MNTIPVLIIPTINRFDLLDQVLNSIDYPVDNILIIDNSNSYNTKRKNVQVLNMPSNLGVATSWNLGIKLFPHAEYWVIGSTDTSWLPGGMEEMAKLSNKDNLVMSNLAWNTFSIGSNIVKKIGLFDENYYPAYSEDTDYMERLRLNNLSDNIIWSTVPVYALGNSMTINSNSKYFEKNLVTNELNAIYFKNKIYNGDGHINCYKWDLQRRIDQDWDVE